VSRLVLACLLVLLAGARALADEPHPAVVVELDAGDQALLRAGLGEALAVELGDRTVIINEAAPAGAVRVRVVDRGGQIAVTTTWPDGRTLARTAARPVIDADAVDVVRFIVGTMVRSQDDDLLARPPPPPPSPWRWSAGVGGGVGTGYQTSVVAGAGATVGWRWLAVGGELVYRRDDVTSTGELAQDPVQVVVPALDLRLSAVLEARPVSLGPVDLDVGLLVGAARWRAPGKQAIGSVGRLVDFSSLRAMFGGSLALGVRVFGPMTVRVKSSVWRSDDQLASDTMIWVVVEPR
jgi:hypothetical protein